MGAVSVSSVVSISKALCHGNVIHIYRLGYDCSYD